MSDPTANLIAAHAEWTRTVADVAQAAAHLEQIKAAAESECAPQRAAAGHARLAAGHVTTLAEVLACEAAADKAAAAVARLRGGKGPASQRLAQRRERALREAQYWAGVRRANHERPVAAVALATARALRDVEARWAPVVEAAATALATARATESAAAAALLVARIENRACREVRNRVGHHGGWTRHHRQVRPDVLAFARAA